MSYYDESYIQFRGRKRVPAAELWVGMSEVDPHVQAVIDILQDWYDAIEGGTANDRQPDPLFQRSGHLPPLSDDDVERIIKAIDDQYEREVHDVPGRKVGADAGPGFGRLEGSARRAFVEAIFAYIDDHENGFTGFRPYDCAT